MIFDSHCHLNDKILLDDIPGVITRAKENGVDRFWSLDGILKVQK